MQNSTVPSHLAIGHWWSGQHHLDCFIQSAFSSGAGLLAFLRGQFSELRRPLSRLLAGQHVTNFSHLGEVSASTQQLTGQNVMHSPWGGSKGP